MTDKRFSIDRALQILTALTAALMAASAGQHWPTLALFSIALAAGTFSALSSRVVGAGKPMTVLDAVLGLIGTAASFAVPTAQACSYALPSWAVVVCACVGGVLGVTTHGPLAPKAAP